MKYNFQDTSIIVGQIKELLRNFNLPMIPVYSEKTVLYDNRVYIKNNDIVKYHKLDNSFEVLGNYMYGKEFLNLTKKMELNSSNYDTYTHKCLGDYLRFIRDYKKINLMSMYNCFGNQQPSRIYSSVKLSSGNYLIDTDDKRYNFYIIPVKFNEVYTIAIDSAARYDIFCCFYNNKFITDTPVNLIEQSLLVKNGSNFNSPFIYNTNFKCAENCWRKEKDLMMVLKLPQIVNSSVVILEGNYTESCNIVDGTLVTDYHYNDNNLPENYLSKISLLQYNNKISYPFSDRLVEYLTNNAITSQDTINKNIERVQDGLYPVVLNGYYGLWDESIRSDIYKHSIEEDKTKGKIGRYGNIIKRDITKLRIPKSFRDLYKDLIYCVDKDVETMISVLWDTLIILDHGVGITFDKKIVNPVTKIVVKYGEDLPVISVPSKSGFKLDGYYNKPDGEGIKYYNDKGNPLLKWNILTTKETLYAYWVEV